MRVLVVANLFPSERAPAFGSFVGVHVDALRRAGHEVDVVAITDPAVHRRIVRKYSLLGIRAAFRAVVQRSRGRGYAVIEAHIAIPTGVVALPAAILSGSRLVVYAHGTDVARIGPRSTFTRAMSRLALGRADLVIANSAFTRDCVLALSSTRRPVTVISPGVIYPRDLHATKRAGVLFVGRLVAEKGVADLIHAVGKLDPRPALTIVGDGPERGRFEEMAVAVGVAATFVGAIHPSEVRHWYERAQIVVLPSTIAEGLGLVALEGMAYGAIVVATSVGGLRELVDDGVNGFLVEPGSSSALAKGIEKAMRAASSAEGAPIVRAARATAAAHDVDRSATTTIEAYRALVGNGQ